MNHRFYITRLLRWLSLFVFMAPVFAGQSQTSWDKEETREFKIFTDRVQAYVKMQRNLEASLPTLKPTKDVAQIVEYQRALAGEIVKARRNAHRGDIFTHEVAERFRKIIRHVFHGPEGRLARQTIRRDDPSRVMARLHINDVFPEGIELTTTPPDLLFKLPDLPQELTYRFVGDDLALIDIKARLILDLIENVIP